MQTPVAAPKTKNNFGNDSEYDDDVPDLVRPAPPLMSGPMDLMSRALRGFCTPPTDTEQRRSQRRSLSNHFAADDEQHHHFSSAFCLPSPEQHRQQPPSSSGSRDHQNHPKTTITVDTSSSSTIVTSSTSDDDYQHSLKETDIPGYNKQHEDEDDDDEYEGDNECEADEDDDDDDDDDDDEMLVIVETVPGTGRVVRVVRALEIFVCTVALLAGTVVAVQRLGVKLEFEWSAKAPPPQQQPQPVGSISPNNHQRQASSSAAFVVEQQGGRRDAITSMCADGADVIHQEGIVDSPQVCNKNSNSEDDLFSVYHASAEQRVI